MFNIPIIAYHKISDKSEVGLTTISKSTFTTQMDFLKSKGYETICFGDLRLKNTLPEKPIIITFDDGYESIYTNASPIMEKYGFKSVIFVVTDYLGKFNMWEAVRFQQKFKHLSKDQILWLRRQGHEIASHSKNHKYLPLLKQKDVEDEIIGSKKELESLLGEQIISFCYPYGRHNQKNAAIAEKAGYAYATSNIRLINSKHSQFSLQRRSIYSIDSIKIFESKISSNKAINKSYLFEIFIQKGALASIALNFIRSPKSHF